MSRRLFHDGKLDDSAGFLDFAFHGQLPPASTLDDGRTVAAALAAITANAKAKNVVGTC